MHTEARQGTTGSPAQVSAELRAALAAGELETAGGCFTRDACFVTPDGTAVHGREGVRQVLRQLTESLVDLRAECYGVLATEEAALLHERWSIASGDGRGNHYVRSFRTGLVMRPVERRWKVAIAAPWDWLAGPQLVARPMASSGNASITPM